jgi:O-antigen/teichoic acid export membrane protein
MGLIFIPLYIKYLGIEAYGLIGMFVVIQMWLGLLDLGMTPALGREMARYTAGAHSAQSIRDLLRSLETIYYSLALLIALSVWGGSDYLAGGLLKVEKLSPATVAQTVSLMGLVVALRFCEGIYRGALIGLQKQVWYNSANAVLNTLRHGGAVAVLILIAPTLQAFFYWQAFISILTVAVFALAIDKHLPKVNTPARFGLQSIRSIWKFSTGVYFASILALILNLSDKTLLAGMVSLTDYGYYTLAASVTSALFMLTTPVVQAVYPHLVEHIAKKETDIMLVNYHKAARLITLITAVPAILIALNAQEVVFLWTRNAEVAHATSGILSVLAIGSLFNCLIYLPNHMQLAHGWVGHVVKINLVFIVVYVPAIFFIVPIYGALGTAFVCLGLNFARFLIVPNIMYSRLYPAHKRLWYMYDVLVPILVISVPLLLLLFLRPLFSGTVSSLVLYFISAMLIAFMTIMTCYPDYRRSLLRKLNWKSDFMGKL